MLYCVLFQRELGTKRDVWCDVRTQERPTHLTLLLLLFSDGSSRWNLHHVGRNWVNDYGFDRSDTYLFVCTHFCIWLACPVPILAKLYQLFEYVVMKSCCAERRLDGWDWITWPGCPLSTMSICCSNRHILTYVGTWTKKPGIFANVQMFHLR